MGEKIEDYIEEIHINSWKEVSEYYTDVVNKKQQWIFRGQKNASWGLQSSLERAIIEFSEDNDITKDDDVNIKRTKIRSILSKGIEGNLVDTIELGLLRRFKRQCEKYLEVSMPDEDDFMAWFALMQHYGAPTRLQDWSYSFYVSLFFAIDSSDTEAVVWALDNNSAWINISLKKALNDEEAYNDIMKDQNAIKQGTFKKIFMRPSPIDVVCPMNPFSLNERLSIQQGVFLCPGNVLKPFEDNLFGLLSQYTLKDKLKKLIFTENKRFRKEIFQHLHRMNINPATLYPGLQGFAMSMKSLLAFPGMLKP
jgi:hypothetical protein